MDHLDKLVRQIGLHLFLLFAFFGMVLTGGWWVGSVLYQVDVIWVLVGSVATTMALGFVLALTTAHYLNEPMSMLRQAILHISPSHGTVNPPNLEAVRLGRELVTAMALSVYELASGKGRNSTKTSGGTEAAGLVLNSLPLPVFAIGKDGKIAMANLAALRYLGLPGPEVVGKEAYLVLDLSFPSEHTLENWLSEIRGQKVTAQTSWEHVRLKIKDDEKPRQFDLAVYYTQDSPTGIETILAMFDRSSQYGQDDNAASFVALAVHELRTPLTMLRGYIEVFEEELSGKLDAEMESFMRKMQTSAQQLTTFVNNILNVARVDADQLVLQLHQENWESILRAAVDDMALKAQVHNKTLEVDVAAGLPEVAADRVSVYEVINNLVDNAIKYSGEGQKKIVIKSALSKDGMIETTVQDTGVGIPAGVLPTLFQKFNRNHRTRDNIGGTGLGLYLSKAIVDAHGGNIWVRSKEGEGTTVGFTLSPYDKLAAEQKNGENKEIVRQAHGWIKNHSLYRR